MTEYEKPRLSVDEQIDQRGRPSLTQCLSCSTVTGHPEDSPFGRIGAVPDPEGALLQLCLPSEATPE